MQPQPVLEVKDLSLSFQSSGGRTQALNGISFQVRENEILAIVGESGSGKSVTALSILQLLNITQAKYTSGEICFWEKNKTPVDLLPLDPKKIQEYRGSRISIIFQEPMTSLNPVFTCGYQVTEAILQHNRISYAAAKQKTLSWFEKVKLPDPASVFRRYPHQLSGGQKQRVMIAMAMCCNPSLLICDEPTTALDVTVQKTILDLVKELRKQTGMAVIFITHDLGVVAEVADRCLVMYKGRIVEENSVSVLFSQPVHPYTKALLACRPANHPKGERLPVVSDFLSEETANPLIRAEQQTTLPLMKRTPETVMLDVQNLSVHFHQKSSVFGRLLPVIKAVDDVSFTLHTGETLGLVGESGCGKTSLGRCLLRLLEPTAGKIYYKGTDLLLKNRKELLPLRKDIQIIFQDPFSSLNPRIQIGNALSEPLKVHEPGLTRQQRKDRIISLLEKVDLKPSHYNRYPHEFSGGQRQRIVIARALSLQPSFIVCDESVSALDVSVQAQVLNLISDLKREFGFTVIFISHDLSVVHYISDRIMVMQKGKIIETGTAHQIYHHPSHPYSAQLIRSIPAIRYA
ncbi:MAG: dipeptide ABC transporter ATP-binding protein [Terrimonas sp.]|nr:dipeptide ABC transporter ATP-binding protein [Terrimonas sp.]